MTSLSSIPHSITTFPYWRNRLFRVLKSFFCEGIPFRYPNHVSPGDIRNFAARSHSLCTHCLRFVVRIAPANDWPTRRKTRFRRGDAYRVRFCLSQGFNLRFHGIWLCHSSILLNGTCLSHRDFRDGQLSTYIYKAKIPQKCVTFKVVLMAYYFYIVFLSIPIYFQLRT